MEKWKQKAIVQKAISFLPFPHRVNFLFQKYVTKGVYLTDDYFTDRLTHARAHISALRTHATGQAIDSSLELGTGWYPVVPVSLYLAGADDIHTVDISPLCRRSDVLATLRMFVDYYRSGELSRFIDVRPDRWRALSNVARNSDALTAQQILKSLRISYTVGDARKLPLPGRSVSLITSNNTLEHVYPAVLREILRELKRVAASGGVMSHFIDMSDHFAHFDRSITIYNYLQYSKRQWARIDNAIQPQNRLRISDYRILYAELGIPITEEICREGSLDELSAVPVDAEFRGIPPADLVVSHCLLVSRM